MSDQQDNQEAVRLKQVDAELNRSLRRCWELVADCRTKLAANSNEPFLLGSDIESDGESDRA